MPTKRHEEEEQAEVRKHEDAEAMWPRPGRRRATETATAILMGQTVIAIAVVFAICYIAKLPLVVLLVSILIAFILAPLVNLLEMGRVPRPVGSFIAVVALGALLYGGMYFGYNRVSGFVQDLPKYSSRIKHVVMRFREQAQKIQQTTETVLPGNASDDKQTVKVQQQSNWSDVITSNFGAVTEVLLMISFIPFLVYFMLSWQDHVRAATVMLFKMENRNTAYVTLGRISAMIHSFINGNLVVGIFTSIISLIVFGALHLPYFYFLGFISGFLSLVPYLGVVLALIPPVVAGIGVLHSGGMIAIIFTVLGVHVFALNVLYPKLIGKRLQLNPLAVTVSLLIWGFLWGAPGLILAVPITGAMKIIFDNVESLRPYGAWLGE
jgi:predicted PurR-regulated permease PerM